MMKAIAEARPGKGEPVLYTIGYEGRSLEGFLNALILSKVTLLCDVRQNPISRKYGFSKSTLKKSCAGVGIQYEHLPELGIPSENRRNLTSQEDYNSVFEAYVRKILPSQANKMTAISDWIKKGERVALTCYEKLPAQCHRSYLAKEMERRFGRVCTPKHL